ncbi:outer membrane protein assembly factor BamB family protein [Halomonas sp. LS-001]
MKLLLKIITNKVCGILVAGVITLVMSPSVVMGASTVFQANLERTGVYEDIGPEKTPALVWKFDAGAPVISTPLVDNGMVYFVDFEDGIYALNQADGSVVWEKEIDGQPSYQIAISEDSLLVGVYQPDDFNGHLLALDRLTGEEHWRFEMDYSEYAVRMTTPTVYGDTVLLTSDAGYLVALDVATGESFWGFAVDGNGAQPIISDDVVYYRDGSQTLYALQLDSGEEIWRIPSPIDYDISYGTPSVNGCCVFAIVRNDETALVRKIDKKSGELVAEFVHDFSVTSSVSLADGVVFFGDDGDGKAGSHGHMNTLDMEARELIWRFKTEGFMRGPASIAGNTVYFGSADTYLYAVDRHTGDLKWRYKTDGIVNSAPAIVDGRVYFGSLDGHVYVLE